MWKRSQIVKAVIAYMLSKELRRKLSDKGYV
jgi:hypothetical protein